MAGIKIEGLDKLQKHLKKQYTLDDVRNVVKMNGAELQKKAQRKAPIGTPESTGIPGYKGGTLRGSIGLEITEAGMTAEVEATAEYAPYVEYGTRFMKAQPYIRPSLEEQKKSFKNDLSKLLKK